MSNSAKLAERFKNALWEGNTFEVENLLTRGLDLNCAKLWDSLHEAIAAGNVTLVRLILATNIHLESTDPDYNNQTPLQLAVDKRQLEIVKLLLDHGANIEVESSIGNSSPLSQAAQLVWPECIKLLLENGAKAIPQGDVIEEIPLMAVTKNAKLNHADHVCALDLLYDGTMAQCTTDEMKTELTNLGLREAILAKSVDCMNYFLARGASPNQIVKLGKLHYVDFDYLQPISLFHMTFYDGLHSGNMSCWQLLVKHGADLNLCGPTEPCKFLTIYRHGRNKPLRGEVTRMLIELGGDPEEPLFRKGDTMTYIFKAFSMAYWSALCELLKANADASTLRPDAHGIDLCPLVAFTFHLTERPHEYNRDFTIAILANGLDLGYLRRALNRFHERKGNDYYINANCKKFDITPYVMYEYMVASQAMQDLDQIASSPMRLTDLCRAAVRKGIRHHRRGLVKDLVAKLPLPFAIKRFVLLEDLNLVAIESSKNFL